MKRSVARGAAEVTAPSLFFYGGQLVAFLPMLLFIVVCMLLFVVFHAFDLVALSLGAFVGLGLCSLFATDKKEYWAAAGRGIASPISGMVILVLFEVGIFSKLMAQCGLAEGFVWMGNAFGMTGGAFTAFTFITTCVIATATGSSIGTMLTAVPIFYLAGITLGANPAMLAGAILSGAIFGDNLAPVSDTTIISASTQKYENKEGSADIWGVVASRSKYSFIAAGISTLLFALLGGGEALEQGSAMMQNASPTRLAMLIPAALLVAVAIRTRDIYSAILVGILSGTIMGLLLGFIRPANIFAIQDGAVSGFVLSGINNMTAVVTLCISLFALIGVMEASHATEKMIEWLMGGSVARSPMGTEISIALGIILSSIAMGGATGPSLIMFSPLGDKIGRTAHLHPYRRANLLDGFANSIPVALPFSCFVFIMVGSISGLAKSYSFIVTPSPVAISLASFHPWALFFVFAASVVTGVGRRFEGSKGEPVKSL